MRTYCSSQGDARRELRKVEFHVAQNFSQHKIKGKIYMIFGNRWGLAKLTFVFSSIWLLNGGLIRINSDIKCCGILVSWNLHFKDVSAICFIFEILSKSTFLCAFQRYRNLRFVMESSSMRIFGKGNYFDFNTKLCFFGNCSVGPHEIHLFCPDFCWFCSEIYKDNLGSQIRGTLFWPKWGNWSILQIGTRETSGGEIRDFVKKKFRNWNWICRAFNIRYVKFLK